MIVVRRLIIISSHRRHMLLAAVKALVLTRVLLMYGKPILVAVRFMSSARSSSCRLLGVVEQMVSPSNMFGLKVL